MKRNRWKMVQSLVGEFRLIMQREPDGKEVWVGSVFPRRTEEWNEFIRDVVGGVALPLIEEEKEVGRE